MRELPLVSILIPVYQRENFIAAAIECAQRQTYENIEIVIVDNASSDRTWEICQAYAAKDKRVRVYRNEVNVGPVGNWKRCIDYARGYYVKILWSDDEIAPEYLDKAVAVFNEGDVAFVFTSAIIGSEFDYNAKAHYRYGNTGRHPSITAVMDFLHGKNAPVSPGCAVFRLSDVRDSLGEKISSPSISDFGDHGAGPDLLMFLLTATRYRYIGFVDEPLSFFREHPGSISIHMKRVDLLDRYLQAKLWFAHRFLSEKLYREFCARSWISRLAYSRRYSSPDAFVARFGDYVLRPSMINSAAIAIQEIMKRLWP